MLIFFIFNHVDILITNGTHVPNVPLPVHTPLSFFSQDDRDPD